MSTLRLVVSVVFAVACAFGCSSAPSSSPGEPVLTCFFSGTSCQCSYGESGDSLLPGIPCEPERFPGGALCCADAASGWSTCQCEAATRSRGDLGCRGDAALCACSISVGEDPYDDCPAPPTSTCCVNESDATYCRCAFDSCAPGSSSVPSCAPTAESKCCEIPGSDSCTCSPSFVGGCALPDVEVDGCAPRTGVCCLASDGEACRCGEALACDEGETEVDECSVDLIAPALVVDQVCPAGLIEVSTCTDAE
jgi:hypothetical protein